MTKAEPEWTKTGRIRTVDGVEFEEHDNPRNRRIVRWIPKHPVANSLSQYMSGHNEGRFATRAGVTLVHRGFNAAARYSIEMKRRRVEKMRVEVANYDAAVEAMKS